ncbi:MAG: hemin uptake protein HemP [Rhizobiaceae bacterium]|nr:hemin uptake protein HemP [Rhizobiaceae bacterium]
MVQNKAHNAPNTALVYQSDQLFQGQKEIIIQHEDASYRLRITRQGKLILTK